MIQASGGCSPWQQANQHKSQLHLWICNAIIVERMSSDTEHDPIEAPSLVCPDAFGHKTKPEGMDNIVSCDIDFIFCNWVGGHSQNRVLIQTNTHTNKKSVSHPEGREFFLNL